MIITRKNNTIRVIVIALYNEELIPVTILLTKEDAIELRDKLQSQITEMQE